MLNKNYIIIVLNKAYYFTQCYENYKNKWQDRLWGPAQGLEITLHIETYSKNRIKDGHNSTKIGASNIFGGNQLRFQISAQ